MRSARLGARWDRGETPWGRQQPPYDPPRPLQLSPMLIDVIRQHADALHDGDVSAAVREVVRATLRAAGARTTDDAAARAGLPWAEWVRRALESFYGRIHPELGREADERRQRAAEQAQRAVARMAQRQRGRARRDAQGRSARASSEHVQLVAVGVDEHAALAVGERPIALE